MARPRWLPGILALVGFAVGLGFGCNRKVEDRPDVERLCATHCDRLYSDCYQSSNPNHSNAAECTASCTEIGIWEHECRWHHAAVLECAAELSCEDFHQFLGPYPVPPGSDPTYPCLEFRLEEDACVNGQEAAR